MKSFSMTRAEVKIRQLEHQSETWKRDLEFIKEENIALKNRVGEIISNIQVTSDFLERIEAYQDDFIAKDQALRLILWELKKWDKLLAAEQYADGEKTDGNLIALQKKLSNKIESFMNEFTKLKFDFNNYMSEKL
jgi:hypothetical protein